MEFSLVLFSQSLSGGFTQVVWDCDHLMAQLGETQLSLCLVSWQDWVPRWLLARSLPQFFAVCSSPESSSQHGIGCPKWQRAQNDSTMLCKLILVLMPHHLCCIYSLEVTQSSLYLRREAYTKAWILGGRDPWGPSKKTPTILMWPFLEMYEWRMHSILSYGLSITYSLI